jgi:hypothetical protein
MSNRLACHFPANSARHAQLSRSWAYCSISAVFAFFAPQQWPSFASRGAHNSIAWMAWALQ